MKISVIHPSYKRFKQASITAEKWLNNADGFIEYIFSLEITDPVHPSTKAGNYDIKHCYSNTKSAISAINKAAEKATGDLLVVISDDFDCPPHWDTNLIYRLLNKSDFCVKTEDGLQPTLITMPIMDRVYYERYGYIYHPDYLHMFADQELTSVALMTGKYIKLPLKFEHLHYSTGKTPKDDINVKNDFTWKQGETLFHEHLKTNFGIENPVMQYKDIKWK